MITITVKWLSGDLLSVEVPKNTLVCDLAEKVTTEPLYKISFFRGEEVLPHHYKLKADELLCIVVAEPPRSVVVYKSIRKAYCYVIDTADTRSFSNEELKEFDRVHIDYLSFAVFFSMEQREKISKSLVPQDTSCEHVDVLGLKHFRETFLAKRMGDEIRLLWKDFIRAFSMMLSENIEAFCFPTLYPELKRCALTPKQWASYCILKIER